MTPAYAQPCIAVGLNRKRARSYKSRCLLTTIDALKLVVTYLSSVGMLTDKKRNVRLIGISKHSAQKTNAATHAMYGVPHFGCTRARAGGSTPERAIAKMFR